MLDNRLVANEIQVLETDLDCDLKMLTNIYQQYLPTVLKYGITTKHNL